MLGLLVKVVPLVTTFVITKVATECGNATWSLISPLWDEYVVNKLFPPEVIEEEEKERKKGDVES